MIVRNVNRVPVKKWRQWSPMAKTVFNRVYDYAMGNQWSLLHPQQEKVPMKHWKTTAWNAAWIAADAVDDTIPTEIVEVAA